MTILTPELIEKAARAAAERMGYEPDLYVANGLKRWETFAAPMNTALQAVLPDVVASCAAIADIAGDPAIAAEIRSLLNKEGK